MTLALRHTVSLTARQLLAAWASRSARTNAGSRPVSCASAGFCVAVDDVGNVLTSSNPNGGAAACGPASSGSTRPP